MVFFERNSDWHGLCGLDLDWRSRHICSGGVFFRGSELANSLVRRGIYYLGRGDAQARVGPEKLAEAVSI